MKLQKREVHGLVALSLTVLDVAKSACSFNSYLVLGSEGDSFLVEICSGLMKGRTIHKTIHISFDNHKDWLILNQDVAAKEIVISLRDPSYLIAFLALLVAALNAEIKVLHPLDANGNFLIYWQEALDIATSDTRP
jgi:hypothetical protein